MEVERLKEIYESLAKKHKLPSFNEIEENFEIYKIDRECDFMLRSIRKQMMEKIVNSTSFIEMLLTGNNAPRMYFVYLKSINGEEYKKLERIYELFSKLIVESLELEIETSEKSEAELIKTIFKIWISLKADFKSIFKNIKNPSISPTKKERSYFG